eukprot:349509-Pyramimonas_sp.AAC.1
MKTEIATAVDPLKHEMSDFRSLAAVEARSSSGLSKQQITLLNSVDVAFRGFTMTGLETRTAEIEQFLVDSLVCLSIRLDTTCRNPVMIRQCPRREF